MKMFNVSGKNTFGFQSFVLGLKVTYGQFLERKMCNPLAYVAARLKKLRGSEQPYIFNVKIVLV